MMGLDVSEFNIVGIIKSFVIKGLKLKVICNMSGIKKGMVLLLRWVKKLFKIFIV